MLMGIENVADEVGLGALAKRSRLSMPFALIVYALLTILEVPSIQGGIDVKIFTIMSAITLIGVFSVVCINLVTIYSAYMKICMPDDVDNSPIDKSSRFGFVNKYREHTEQKQREYVEYKLEKLKKKNSKKK